MKRITSVVLAIVMVIMLGSCSVQDSTGNSEAVTNDGKLRVHFIDVGQADSILIQQKNHNMLIDAGNNGDADKVVEYLKKQGVNKLDYLILTHPHEDHIGGADAVIKAFKIDNLYMPKVTTTTKTYKDVVDAIKAKNLKATAPSPGDSFKFGDASCTVLAPNSSRYDDLNDYSIVIKLNFGSNSFLFTGDASGLSESEILNKKFDIKAEVLKVGHHGSRTSTSDAFLSKVNPKYAVISVGKGNDYDHPHKETLAKLKNAGIKVYRTDEKGTIICTSDGKNISFE